MRDNKKRAMFENIYDYLKVLALPKNQDDEWAKLSRKFAKQAETDLKRFIKNKHVEWDGDNNIITIGRQFKFKLI